MPANHGWMKQLKAMSADQIASLPDADISVIAAELRAPFAELRNYWLERNAQVQADSLWLIDEKKKISEKPANQALFDPLVKSVQAARNDEERHPDRMVRLGNYDTIYGKTANYFNAELGWAKTTALMGRVDKYFIDSQELRDEAQELVLERYSTHINVASSRVDKAAPDPAGAVSARILWLRRANPADIRKIEPQEALGLVEGMGLDLPKARDFWVELHVAEEIHALQSIHDRRMPTNSQKNEPLFASLQKKVKDSPLVTDEQIRQMLESGMAQVDAVLLPQITEQCGNEETAKALLQKIHIAYKRDASVLNEVNERLEAKFVTPPLKASGMPKASINEEPNNTEAAEAPPRNEVATSAEFVDFPSGGYPVTHLVRMKPEDISRLSDNSVLRLIHALQGINMRPINVLEDCHQRQLRSEWLDAIDTALEKGTPLAPIPGFEDVLLERLLEARREQLTLLHQTPSEARTRRGEYLQQFEQQIFYQLEAACHELFTSVTIQDMPEIDARFQARQTEALIERLHEYVKHDPDLHQAAKRDLLNSLNQQPFGQLNSAAKQNAADGPQPQPQLQRGRMIDRIKRSTPDQITQFSDETVANVIACYPDDFNQLSAYWEKLHIVNLVKQVVERQTQMGEQWSQSASADGNGKLFHDMYQPVVEAAQAYMKKAPNSRVEAAQADVQKQHMPIMVQAIRGLSNRMNMNPVLARAVVDRVNSYLSSHISPQIQDKVATIVSDAFANKKSDKAVYEAALPTPQAQPLAWLNRASLADIRKIEPQEVLGRIKPAQIDLSKVRSYWVYDHVAEKTLMMQESILTDDKKLKPILEVFDRNVKARPKATDKAIQDELVAMKSAADAAVLPQLKELFSGDAVRATALLEKIHTAYKNDPSVQTDASAILERGLDKLVTADTEPTTKPDTHITAAQRQEIMKMLGPRFHE